MVVWTNLEQNSIEPKPDDRMADNAVNKCRREILHSDLTLGYFWVPKCGTKDTLYYFVCLETMLGFALLDPPATSARRCAATLLERPRLGHHRFGV